MTFKENARLDTSQVRSGGRGGGGGGGGLAAGGGIGGIILLILYMIFGGGLGGGGGGTTSGSPWNFSAGDVSGTGEEGASDDFSHCQTGADANEHRDCRVVGTVNSVQGFWESAWSQYEPAKTVIFSGTVQTGCGTANS